MGEVGELVDVGADAAELAMNSFVDARHGRGERPGERGVADVLAERNPVKGSQEAELLVLFRREADRHLDSPQAERVFPGASTLGHWVIQACELSEQAGKSEPSEHEPFPSPGLFPGLGNIAGSSAQ
jgi:hypothetical protein